MRFILFIGWIGFLVVFVLPLFLSFLRKPPLSRKDSLEKGSDMARDQICGVYIPKDRAETLKLKGKLYYFCGKECQSKFLAGNG